MKNLRDVWKICIDSLLAAIVKMIFGSISWLT